MLREDKEGFGWTLGDFRDFISSPIHNWRHLEDHTRMVEWFDHFHHSNDFSRAFEKLKRVLVAAIISILSCFYNHFYEMYEQAYDKLLRALSTLDYEMRLDM